MNGQENKYNITSIFTMPLARFGLFVALVLLIINRQMLPAGLIFFLLLTMELARLWSRCSLYKLETRRQVYPGRMFPSEETMLTVEVNNNKWIPVIFQLRQPLLPELAAPDLPETGEERELVSRRYLGWYEGYGHTCGLGAVRRGFFGSRP